MYVYLGVHMCVCVCVCVRAMRVCVHGEYMYVGMPAHMPFVKVCALECVCVCVCVCAYVRV